MGAWIEITGTYDYAEFLTFEDGVLVDINAEALIENIDCDKYKDELAELREIFL